MKGSSMLAWAIIWTLIAIVAVIGMFWNPAQWVCACLAAMMASVFYNEYVKEKK